MSRKLKITIEGKSGTGKSIIAEYIAQCLKRYEIEIEKRGDIDTIADEVSLREMKIEEYMERLTKQGMKVVIEEKQAHRKYSIDDYKAEVEESYREHTAI